MAAPPPRPAITLRALAPTDPAAAACLGHYFAELNTRLHAGFDPALALSPAATLGVFLVAFVDGERPVGCGGLKLHPGNASGSSAGEAGDGDGEGGRWAELKRLWVAPEARGMGVGRRLFEELERRARAEGCRALRLDSNRALTEAMALYRRWGFVEVERFNEERYADFWFEKRLVE